MNEHTINLHHREDTPSHSMRALENLRVLMLPKNSRTPYFTSLLEKGRREFGWTVTVVGPQGTEALWRESISDGGAFIQTPDFNQPQAFETDAAASVVLDAFIAAAERTSGVSASRLLLAGERDIGRGFSRPVFYWFHDKTARRALADNSEPMQVVRRMFAFAKTSLESARPDVVMTGEWAAPICFAFYLAARQMGIPCVVNRLSKLWSGRCYWSASLMMYNDMSQAAAETRRAAKTPASERAVQKLDKFRNRPSTLGYVQQNWNALAKAGGRGSHAEIARIFAAGWRHRLGGGGPPAKPALRLFFDIYRKKWLRLRQQDIFKRYEDRELADMRYVLLALHKDPELTLNFQAYVWASQYNTISTLCGALPDGYRLLVREHRSNTGRRPTRYYKDLAPLPGLKFIDAYDDQFKYIRNAALIVTDNASIGWEGIQLGRPVMTLADTYYDGAALSLRLRIHDHLPAHLLDLVTRPIEDTPARQQAMGAALDAEWEHSVPVDAADQAETLALLAKLFSTMETESGAKPVAISA
jgi:hypothetical protein